MVKFYSGPLSMFGAKAEIAARQKGVDLEVPRAGEATLMGHLPAEAYSRRRLLGLPERVTLQAATRNDT